MNRRKLLLPLAASIVMVLVAILPASAVQSLQTPLPGSAIPKFAQPLPLLSVQGGSINTVFGNQAQTITMCEFNANVLPPGTFAPGVQPTTRVWGYIVGSTCPTTPQDTYIGPVIVNDRGEGSTDITWVNDLGTTETTQVLAYKYSTDQTLHWADPLNVGGMPNMCNHMSGMPMGDCAKNYGEGLVGGAPIPAVVHLHGGEVPPQLDGGPDAWYTSDGSVQGPGYYSFAGAAPNAALYKYPNSQEAGPLWFHDHTLGATRLNVYAGLAGAYYLEDPGLWPTNRTTTKGTQGTCTPGTECLPDNLQSVGQVVPLVIQDRMFDTTGQLFFPSDSAGNILWTPNPEHPYWVPEFVGDTIVVNGKAWPYLDLQPKRYRFLFLNGSNARTYEMFLIDPLKVAVPPNFWVIGTDGGYLDAPVLAKKLTMMPGERYEVIIDFANLPIGTNLILKNTAKTPFPAGAAPQGATTGQIMQFRVSQQLAEIDATYNPALGQPLRSGANAIVRLLPATASTTRQLTLNEVMAMPQTVNSPVTGALTAYPGGPLEILVNNTKWGGERIIGVDANGMYTFEKVPLSTLDNHGNYLTELPKEGETEVWEIVNLTADAHPIHLHLVQFQIINRQSYNTNTYIAAYNAAFPGGGYDPMTGAACLPNVFCPGFGPPLAIDGSDPLSGGKLGGNPDVGLLGKNGKPAYLQGKASPPAPNEAGWKDTVIAYPGQVTRIAVRWAPTDLAANTLPADAYYPFDPSGGYSAATGFEYGYVWHCHIIDHEDNEMMRPDAVYPNPSATRTITNY